MESTLRAAVHLRDRVTGAVVVTRKGTSLEIRVLVVEAHPVTRWGVTRLLEEHTELTVAGEADNAAQAWALVTTLAPDVVVLGLTVADDHGLALAARLRDRDPGLGIVLLTAAEDDGVLLRALDAGASGLVTKSAPLSELVSAVRHAAAAASAFTAVGLAAALRRQRETAAATGELSARERQVLELLVAGRSVPLVALQLHISVSTAKTYVARVYEKLGVRNRAEAVMAAVRLGLAERPAAPAPGGEPRVLRMASGRVTAGAGRG